MSDEFNIPGMIYILYAVQLKKIIASTNIEKTVQEYNDPDLEFELLGRTNDPDNCLLYTSPSPRDRTRSRMPSSA